MFEYICGLRRKEELQFNMRERERERERERNAQDLGGGVEKLEN